MRPSFERKTNIYSMTFSDIECSGGAERDIFELQGSTDTRIRLHSVELSNNTNYVGSSGERLAVEIISGGTSTAVGGTVGAPLNFLDRGATALVTGTYNSTTVGGAGGETLRYGGNWPVGGENDFSYEPASDKRIQTGLNEQLAVRIAENAVAMGISGTIVWEEVGKVPGES
jgi:hypothetical protein